MLGLHQYLEGTKCDIHTKPRLLSLRRANFYRRLIRNCRGILAAAILSPFFKLLASPAADNVRPSSFGCSPFQTRQFIHRACPRAPDYQHASPAAVEAFRDLKFGVRIHWGVYAMLSDASWPFIKMSDEKRQAYQQRYKTFNPAGFNADEWMQLFKTNGVKLMAFTTKHHDGFSMFDDAHTRVKSRVNWTAPGGPQLESCDLAYSVMETPFHRDVVKELTDAAHREGIKIDLYFSHPDWYDADFRPYAVDPVRGKKSAGNSTWPVTPHLRIRQADPFVAPDPTPEETARMVAATSRRNGRKSSRNTERSGCRLPGYQWLGPKVWPELRETIKEARKLQPDVMFPGARHRELW